MSSYLVSGQGVQSLTSGTSKLYVDIDTLPVMSGFGSAHPTNRYDVGLLRLGDGTGFEYTVPIIGGPQLVRVAADIVEVGYSVFGAGVVSIVEYPTSTPPTGDSLMGAFTSTATYTDTEDIVLGMRFYVDSAASLTQLGIYRKSGSGVDLSGAPVAVYDETTHLAVYSGIVEAYAVGWNHWDISPTSLVADRNYVACFLSANGVERLSDFAHPPGSVTVGVMHLGDTLASANGLYEVSSTMVFPTNITTDWHGEDVLAG